MGRQKLLRTLLFVLFFGIGAAALSGSILCEDFLVYYRNKQLLRSAEQSLSRLKSLNEDYDALLEQLQKDPKLIRRFVPAGQGTGRSDGNTVYPRATPEQLEAARKALMEDSNQSVGEPAMPDWLDPCRKPRQRTMLFVAGAGLILISFMCFGPVKEGSREQSERTDRKH